MVDWKNTSGFQTGKENVIGLIFTITDPDQKQGVAFSNDRGRTWERFAGNPVIVSTDGNKDFRDPKVFWHEPLKKWLYLCGDYPMAPNGTGAKYFIGNFDGKNFEAESARSRLAGNFFVGQSFGDIQ